MTVLEVGPVAVRQLPSGDDVMADPDWICAALAGIDDTTVLLDERPVAVEQLWREILSAPALRSGDVLTMVHPSWWPAHRVARLAAWASAPARRVQTRARSTLTAHGGQAAVVIELGTDAVAICRGPAPPQVLSGTVDPDALAARIRDIEGVSQVLIDAPHGIPGAEHLAHELRKILSSRGIRAGVGRVEDAVPPAARPEVRRADSPAAPRVPVRVATAAAAAAVAITLSGVALLAGRGGEPPTTQGRTMTLAEGRVVVQVPADWRPRRVTTGPGSRRVELVSDTDPSAALHVTGSYAPGQTHDTVVEVLQRAIGLEAPGVFADFEPNGHRAGRVVVSYREARVGRDIHWFILLDGVTRISIGCQCPPGRFEAISTVCDQAVGSAHESDGTDAAR